MTPTPKLTKKAFLAKLAALAPADDAQRNAVTCALLGHSHIVDMCFGYVTCARCGEQIGDTLGGAYQPTEDVIVGHGCTTCRANYTKLTWQDTLYATDPFKVQEAAA